MTTKTFTFSCLIKGVHKHLSVTVPLKNGIVRTDKFCPRDLLTGGVDFIKAIRGEIENEFLTDCQKQVIAMSGADQTDSLLDVHIAGLQAVVMDHLARCGRLIFGDLLIYMDCFSLLLEADGFSESEIRDIYPRVTRTIVELYSNYILNTVDLSPFKGSHFDFVLYKISCE